MVSYIGLFGSWMATFGILVVVWILARNLLCSNFFVQLPEGEPRVMVKVNSGGAGEKEAVVLEVPIADIAMVEGSESKRGAKARGRGKKKGRDGR